ncbi:OB-fold nucleic acid binding domain-containing [Cryptosporidium sp. chipmunk genotype I]|uniref:OB-fold nucleic acid binding domain-containing n=1 Tax=Cryptosporidium sp. chipmunk genotype I TaxID=1280935 RepID=UPI00351A8F2B|nr:OB-fold nucleic acid binding domain-containing [Cryptosporidium sp. chipmunk genotype I]
MFFSSGSFGESPFSSRNECNSSTRSSSISKSESSNVFNYFNNTNNDGVENRWNNNNSLVTPSRRVSVATNNTTTNSNNRNENMNRIQRMCLPVNISMIIKSLELSPSVFKMFERRISSVTMVGWITHKEVLASRMIFRISDGTGGIDARFDIDSETLGDEINSYLDDLREGTIVRLVGQVVPGKGDISTYISCYTVIKIKEMSEYAYYHSIEVAYVANQIEQEMLDDDLNTKEEDSVHLSPYTISTNNNTNKLTNDDFNLDLIQDIGVPEDVTDKIHQIVYKTLAYEIKSLKSEEKKSLGINKDHIIKVLRPYYEPSTILSAISDLESKYAVIYEAMDNHYCIL